MVDRLDTLSYLKALVIPSAFALLPVEMRDPRATAMLLAIAQQESRAKYRTQMARGPAHSFLQFEVGTVGLVLTHGRCRGPLENVLRILQYPREPLIVWQAMEHNDILAFAIGRGLLFTLPCALPDPHDPEEGFRQYLAAWRPGAYARGSETDRAQLRAKWNAFFAVAWDHVDPNRDVTTRNA